MKTAAAMSELNWDSFDGMGPIDEADFVSQLLCNCPFITDQDCDPSFSVPPTLWPSDEDVTDMVGLDDYSYFYCFDAANSSLHCWPQWNSTSQCIPTSDYDNYAIGAADVAPVMNESSMSIELFKMDEQNMCPSIQAGPDKLFEDIICLNEEMSGEDLRESGGEPLEVVLLPTQTAQHKKRMQVPESETAAVEEVDNHANPSENPKKKCRVSRNVQRNGENMQVKKNLKTADEEESSMALNGQSSSSYSSEDDSNTSREINGAGSSSRSKESTALNSNGKMRAGRGAATDPQSLYARKRRERINERLRILQNLIPNGTKVDISTMLEEAVQYVKFLQPQIKLLSSDDLWMYAPIAYNGMDIGIDLKISL